MSRLEKCCAAARAEGRKLLIPYIVAGDPNLQISAALLDSLVERGADIIELGIPFSDPASDGPVIQQGSERALANGTTLAQTLELVADFRSRNQDTPIVLMGYLNPIEAMGYERFTERAASAGVDGVLVVDMPPTESGELHGLLRDADIDTIYLVAPTTGARRAAQIAERCSGYLYYVSLKGVTGAALSDPEEIAGRIAELRGQCDLPIVIGFGIKDAASAQSMARLADGVIVGSALVSRIANFAADASPEDASIASATDLIQDLRNAIDDL